jgi:thiamine biosynthesis protein ThiI
MENVILIRFGEVFLKKGNRNRFLRILRSAIRGALKRTPGLKGFTVEAFHGRFLVRAPEGADQSQMDAALLALSRTFGIVSISPGVEVETDYEVIAKTASELGLKELEESRPRHFRVSASRSYKRFPMRSPDIERSIGAMIYEKNPVPVKLKGADLTIGIEIFELASYVFARTISGPGGLPVGSSGTGVLLLSGGIDSPVAGWMMAKRGCHLVGVHFHSYPYTSTRSQEKVVQLARELSRWHGPILLFNMSITPIQEYLRQHVPNDKLVLFYRRTMVRLAVRVAEDMEAKALITGESLAQVASQTMENIAVIDDASPLPILQPLIGMDKMEAVDLAKRIGTFEVSIQPHDDCCSLFLPPHPDTRGKIPEIQAIEQDLADLQSLEDTAFEAREKELVHPV